ncbi:hypothetical protein DJ495_27060 [Raoultella ornithinolytica]|nr:hypothetical protein DJ495_27060 [Raoultella ornithinolytica]
MLGWMIVFLVVGIVIGSLVTSSCINDYVKAGVMQRRGRIYRIVDITYTLKGVSLEIGNFCTLSALFNQSWFVRG